MKKCSILSPCGILGYGFPEKSFMNGMDKNPDAIVVDAGSTDAGPFPVTLDVIFSSQKEYEAVKKANIISKESIYKAYHLKEEDITELVFFDQARGIKVIFNRPISSGTSGDRDVYGAQQHAPLMAIQFDESILD